MIDGSVSVNQPTELSMQKAKIFDRKFLDELSLKALSSARKRQHWNVHVDCSDSCQRLFNAIEPESYLRPHYHDSSQGCELLVGIRGYLKVVVFDSHGNVTDFVDLIPGLNKSIHSAAIEIPVYCYHTVISYSPGSILLEVKNGPFLPSSAKNFAHWAPEEGGDAGSDYLKDLIVRINSF